ncbi:hypothetical protein [Spirosoma litoris]
MIDTRMVKQPKKLRAFILILAAAGLFFLAMSSVALGVIEVIQNDTTGIWLVSVGIILHGTAFLVALGGGRRPKHQLINS